MLVASDHHQNVNYLERLLKHEGEDATYHCTIKPLVMDRGRGSLVWDVAGDEYIDLCAGFGVMAFGHGSTVSQRVFASLEPDTRGSVPLLHGMGDVYPTRDKVELLETLQAMLPSYLTKGVLALTGAQAVEIALKTALLTTGQSGVIAFEHAYHGLDLGVLPLTSREDFKSPFRSWIAEKNVIRLPYGCSAPLLQQAIGELQQRGVGFAAVIVEPIQGRAGIVEPPAGWLALLREVTQKQNALLIFDEIFTGLGRIGSLSSAAEVPADLICLGKALGGGMPLSACFGSAEAMKGWPVNVGEAIHTGTFFGHPLSCRMATATLNELRTGGWVEKVHQRSQDILTHLRSTIGQHPMVKDIRGRGYFIGVEFHGEPGIGAKVMDHLRYQKVIALASGSLGQGISMTPALNIELALWKRAIDQLAGVLNGIHSNK